MSIADADLNLLKALAVLLEERHISRAAARMRLSQPAMSRTLARVRHTIGDELLVRAGHGYELTPRARAIQAELDAVLPRIAGIMSGGDFVPATATDTVRIACSDYVPALLGRSLFPRLFREAPHLSLEIKPLGAETFEELDRGRLDLAFTPVIPGASLRWIPLFQEKFNCVMAADHPLAGEAITLEDLSRYPHLSVVLFSPESMVADRRLLDAGVRPPTRVHVPYFSAAMATLPGTQLIAVLPRRFVRLHAADPRLHIGAPPPGIGSFGYGLAWHPRLDEDKVQQWFRAVVIEEAENT